MANVQLTAGAGTYIATNTVARDGQTENVEIINIGDPSTATCASVTAPGTSGSNAIAIQGVVGGVPQNVSVGGNTPTITQLSSATNTTPLYVKASAGRVCRLVNTATTALTGSTITIIDQSSGTAVAGNVIYSCVGLAAGQIIDLQIPTANGIGIYLSGTALSTNIVLTWS